MNLCILDGKKIRNRRELHEVLAAGLDLPAWYGGNWDVLYDPLTEPVERALKIRNFRTLTQALGPYAHRFWRANGGGPGKNPRFHLEWETRAEPSETAK